MKVFVSSVIAGFENFRDAAAKGARALGHQVVMAEAFPSSDKSPRIACLEEVRNADLVLLLLGARYGEPLPPSNIAPTHEEYLEAKKEKPILVFVQNDVKFEDKQRAFVDEVQSWDEGRFRSSFSSAEELAGKITRSLHEYELGAATTPVNVPDLMNISDALVADSQNSYYSSRGPRLRLGVVGGPLRQILRPSEIEHEELGREISSLLLFGKSAIFNMTEGTKISNDNDALLIAQESGSYFSLNESGHISLATALETSSGGFPVLIEENVQQAISALLGVVEVVLDKVDGSRRLSRLVLSMRLDGADYVAWRKRSEFDPNARSMALGHSFRAEKSGAVHLSPPDFSRGALRTEAAKMAEDLTTLLRRRAG